MKVACVTIGCKINTYETEYLTNQFIKHNFRLVSFTEPADIYVINTCAVTNESENKSKKMIRRAIRLNKDAVIIVMGCFVQYRYKELSKIKEISILVGNGYKTKVIAYVKEYLVTRKRIIKISDIQQEPFEKMTVKQFFHQTRAFVKIQDGCNDYCTYCLIPYVRGRSRSKEVTEVIFEVTSLVQNGYTEIVLTGIHLGKYGHDLGDWSLAKLITKLLTIKKLQRLRLSSIEVTEITSELLALFKKSKVLVDHLHIPLQSGSDKLLKLMNRPYDIKMFEEKINEIRMIRPQIAITTDVIVGFPNETENDFNNTYHFIKKINFSKIHVFPYSKKEGTKAFNLEGHIDPNIKKERSKKLLALSKALEQAYMHKFLNKQMLVLCEQKKDNYYLGYTSNYLLVKVQSERPLKNKIVMVKLTKLDYPYIIGTIVNKKS